MAMPVDRCVCSNVTFAQMRSLIVAHGGDERMLRERHNCGGACGMCLPYIRAMLHTGRTSFEVGDPDFLLTTADEVRMLGSRQYHA